MNLYEECGLCPTSPPKPEFCERSVGPIGAKCDCRCHIDAAEAVMRNLEARAIPVEQARTSIARNEVLASMEAELERRARGEVLVYEGRQPPYYDPLGRSWLRARRRRRLGNVADIAEAIAGAPMLLAGLAIATLPTWTWPPLLLWTAWADWGLRRRARLRNEGERELPPARAAGYSGKLQPDGAYDVRAIERACCRVCGQPLLECECKFDRREVE